MKKSTALMILVNTNTNVTTKQRCSLSNLHCWESWMYNRTNTNHCGIPSGEPKTNHCGSASNWPDTDHSGSRCDRPSTNHCGSSCNLFALLSSRKDKQQQQQWGSVGPIHHPLPLYHSCNSAQRYCSFIHVCHESHRCFVSLSPFRSCFIFFSALQRQGF